MPEPMKVSNISITAMSNGDVHVELFNYDKNGNSVKGGDIYMAIDMLGSAISSLSQQARGNVIDMLKNRSKMIIDKMPLGVVLGANMTKNGG